MGSDDRDRFIDAVRVGSIAVVVLGHWLMAAVVRRDGELRAANALASLPGLHLLTWLLQVVPLFFVAAGFANARALARPGRRPAAFLAQRVAHVVPTPVVMTTVASIGLLVAGRAGASPSTLQDVGAVVAQPLWFLAVYLLVALVAPLQLGVHRRSPRSLLVLLPLGAGALDAVRFGTGQDDAATLNYLLVFAFAQELGFWYADGRLQRVPVVGWLVAAVAAYGALVGLTALGPYPVSLIGLPGQMSNMAPPTICVVLLTVGQLAVLLALRRPLETVLHRPRPWRLVAVGNAVALSLFAWHLVALVLASGAAVVLGWGTPPPGSSSWWAHKPATMLLASAVLAGLVAASAPLDRRLTGAKVHSTTTTTATVGAVLAAGAFALVAAWGVSAPLSVGDAALFGWRGVPALAVAAAALGWLLVVAPRRAR